MLSVQPVHLWKYVSFRSLVLPMGVKRMFYLSWEDALWDLLEQKNVPAGSVILTPEFFCGDVELNIQAHGYDVAHYPVDKRLKTTEQQLVTAIKKYHPRVLVIFHAVGITNQLFEKRAWLRHLPKDCLIIEDSVHRIISPKQLRFVASNHFFIDSLRKVVPIQGSVLYGRSEDLLYSVPKLSQSLLYSIKVHLHWLRMIWWWSWCQVFSGYHIALTFAARAERAMLQGYDVIGDAPKASPGWGVLSWLQTHLDFSRIYATKTWQVQYYQQHLKKYLPKTISVPPLAVSDWGQLRGYPLILDLRIADAFLKLVRDEGLLVRFELNDSTWSTKQKIVYLPLGPYLTEKHIAAVYEVVSKAIRAVT